MLRFIKKIALFLLLFSILIAIGVILPQTPRASRAHILAQRDKDSLLREVSPPRLILIGGSNTSMSLNSQMVYDSLGLYPVNTGLSASIGLFYMLDNTLRYVKAGDVVIVCPEYSQFYEDLAMGTEDLLRIVLDKSPRELGHLHFRQLSNSLKYLPKYALAKFKPSEYLFYENENEVYLRSSFNHYGDMTTHWFLEGRSFATLPPLVHAQYDSYVIDYLHQFKKSVEEKGAQLYITFPALHEPSFDQDSIEINRLAKSLQDGGFTLLGSPSRYRMPDSILFDTPYHLIQPGVNHRTHLLMEDLRKTLTPR